MTPSIFTRCRMALLASASLTLPGFAVAQVAPATDAVVEEIVVTGYRAQNAQAVIAKRDSATIADFLSADEIGQQPDYNIADSFRRAPGVQTVFDEDEGRYVSIRGLNPDYTLSTFNGLVIASSERGNRRINLEMVPSGAVRRLEIIKARTPDIEGNAIGGTTNLVTRSAFDSRERTFFVADAFVGLSDSTAVPGTGFNRSGDDGMSFRGSATLTHRFGANEEFGILATGSFTRKRRDQERFAPNAYPDPATTGGVEMPNEFLYLTYPNTVERYGGQVALEYRPDDSFRMDIGATYYTQVDNELRHSFAIGRSGTTTATGDDTANVSAASGFVRFNDYPIEKPLLMVQAHAEWQPDEDNSIKLAGGTADARFLETSNELRFNMASNSANAYAYTLDEGVPRLTFANDAAIQNAANYTFAYYRPYEDDSQESVREGRIDYGHNAEREDEGFGIGVGGKYRRTTRDFDRYQLDYSGTGVGTGLTLADFLASSVYQGPYNPVRQNFIDFASFKTFFDANPGRFPINARATFLNGILSDYVVTEDVLAGYGSLIYATDTVRIVGGVRYERTDVEVERVASVTRPAGAAAPADLVQEVLPVPSATTRQYIVRADSTSRYADWLPSLLVTWDIGERLKLRASYARAIGRPNPSDLAANQTISETGTPTISRGNADLRPRKSDNFDIQLDYYFAGGNGVMSLGLFRKEIRDDIFRATSTEVIDGVTYQVTQPENVARATVNGLELNFIHNDLAFLPVKGFGVSANATLFDTSTSVLMANGTSRTLDQLLLQPDFLANAAIFYQADPVQFRLTYAYVGKTISTISTTVARDDQTERPLHQLDFQARYKLNDQISFSGEIRNLTNAHRATYTGADQDLARDLNYYGRQFWLGASVRF